MEKRESSGGSGSGDHAEVRKGPWTMEEDMILINYIANHGEGVWNSLAKSAGQILFYIYQDLQYKLCIIYVCVDELGFDLHIRGYYKYFNHYMMIPVFFFFKTFNGFDKNYT